MCSRRFAETTSHESGSSAQCLPTVSGYGSGGAFRNLRPISARTPADGLRVEEARHSVARQPAMQLANEVLVLAAVTEKDAIRHGAILSHWLPERASEGVLSVHPDAQRRLQLRRRQITPVPSYQFPCVLAHHVDLISAAVLIWVRGSRDVIGSLATTPLITRNLRSVQRS